MPALTVALRLGLMTMVAGAVLFGAAGTLRWPAAWLYLALITAVTVGSRLVVLRRNPDTLLERARFATVEGVEPGDRALVLVVAVIGPTVVLLLAGLDHRFGWSPPVTAASQAVAACVIAAGGALAAWAMAVNPFFSAVARIQEDRDHVVVTAGPYRRVRHPGYAGSVAATLALPALLASLWALVPAALTVLAIVIRTAREDRMLARGLAGYREYAARTRWRLLPGVW